MPRPKPSLDPPSSPAAAPASSSSAPLLRGAPARTHHRSPKPPTLPNLLPDPSSGLLALLVTVAGSSAVDARPLDVDVPPDFLCPRLLSATPSTSQDAAQAWSWAPCDDPQSSTPPKLVVSADLSDRAVRSRKRRIPRNAIADKYIQSDDGRWRKADSWELYGSSSCACLDTSTPTELPVEDDSVSSATSAITSSTMPSLPNGWGGRSTSTDNMTGLILALSLTLAFTLIVLMMGVVLWRRKRRKNKERDSEKSPRSAEGEEPSEEVKRALSKQRTWSRASARWMANVRHSARRRRKRLAAAAAKGSDTSLLTDRQSAQASSSSVSLSQVHTTHREDEQSSSRRRSSRSRAGRQTPSRSSSPASSAHSPVRETPPSPPSHPPAYMSNPTFQRTLPQRYPHLSDAPNSSHDSLDSAPSGKTAPARWTDRSTTPPPESPLPYVPLHSAHVATDDKTVLARMNQLASAPPLVSTSGSSEIGPSVPVLDEDEFEPLPPELQIEADAHVNGDRANRPSSSSDLAHDILIRPMGRVVSHPGAPYSSRNSIDCDVPSYAEDAIRHRPPPFVLPSPSQKVPLTGPAFYEYPNEFEDDVVNVGPDLSPSSPPFDEEPSAPPFAFEYGDAGADPYAIGPSAPPLELADLHGAGPTSDASAPSAPSLDDIDGISELDAHEASSDRGRDRASRPGVEPRAPPLQLPLPLPLSQSGSVDDPDGVYSGAVSSSSGSELATPSGSGRVEPPRYLP